MKYLIYLLIILLIFFRYRESLPVFKNGDLVKITTRVSNEPIIFDKNQYFKVYGLKVYLPKYPEFNYGDTVVVTGIVNGDRLKDPKLVEILESKNFVYSFRQKIIDFYKSNLPEPYSSLVSGITLGSKQMPESFWDKLKSTGTAHIVVASGTNVTMVATFLISSLTYIFKRKYAVFIAIAGIVFYMFISGFEAPIVRAGIMGIITLIGILGGRVVNTWRIFVYTIVIMLLIKPLWISDIGFILSVVATVSILLFQKRIDNLLKFIPNLLREGFSTSLAAQIGVSPIIFVSFGQFNMLSPIINALILWTVPYVMIFGAISGVVGLFLPIIGRFLLFISFPFLWYFEKILSFF